MRVSGRWFSVTVIILCASACGDDDDTAARDAGGSDGGAVDAGLDAEVADGGVDATTPTDGGPRVDAARPIPDVACEDMPLPTPPDTITITARILSNPDGPLAGAHVEVRWRADDSLLVEGDTIADGTFGFDIPTGGVPADVYLVMTADGHPTHYLYTGWPLYEDEMINYRVYGMGIVPVVAAEAHVTLDESMGHIHVTSRDCALQVIEGAEIFVTPTAEEVLYLVGDECTTLVEDLTETGPCGQAIALNVAAGLADVTAAIVEGTAFRPQMVRVEAGALTRITLRPHRP